jgi:hypothetical protein
VIDRHAQVTNLTVMRSCWSPTLDGLTGSQPRLLDGSCSLPPALLALCLHCMAPNGLVQVYVDRACPMAGDLCAGKTANVDNQDFSPHATQRMVRFWVARLTVL